MTEHHAEELGAGAYINRLKDAQNLKDNVHTIFLSDQDGQDRILTVEDIHKKKKNAFYWKKCNNSNYKIARNVESVKILIQECTNCTFVVQNPILTNVIEIWRCEDCTLKIGTDVFTLQADLCKNLTLVYADRKHLGSIVQAGVYNFHVKFENEDALDFESGHDVLSKAYADINDQTDQFITRFVDDKLLTEMVIRLPNGFFSTEREAAEFDRQKLKNDLATTEHLRKMLNMAPALGLDDHSLAAKSKEQTAVEQANLKKEAKANKKRLAGNKAYTAGDYAQAVDHYSAAIEMYPDNHLYWGNRCMAYMQLKQWAQALIDTEKCIALAPAFIKGYYRKGLCLLELQRPTEALAALDEARELAPSDAEILSAHARAKEQCSVSS